MSGADGCFPLPAPALACGLGGTPHTSVGITIHFDVSALLQDFDVEWLDAEGAVMAAAHVAGNTERVAFVEKHVRNYYALRIAFRKTDRPYRYVKIQEIEFGQRVVYDSASLVTAEVTEEADLSGASAPAGFLRFTAIDRKGRLNPVNPEGIYAFLRRGMPLHVAFSFGGAWYPGPTEMWENSSRIVSNGDYVMLIAHEKCDDIVNEFNALF